MSRPTIAMPAGTGPFPAHIAEVVNRLGDPEDGAGEHANLEIVECECDPSVVGLKYRTPIDGGAPWVKGLGAEELAEARKAPHILGDEMAKRKKKTEAPTLALAVTDERRRELADRPVLFLTNAAACRAVKHGKARPETANRVGPGDHFTIQCKPDPKRGELGAGVVWVLAPNQGTIDSVRKSRLTLDEYRESYLSDPAPPEVGRGPERCDPRSWVDLSPGNLRAVGAFGKARGQFREVQAGDTLTCSCSAKDAAVGLCHRTWAAALLLDAGWRVVLDGVEIDPDRSADLLTLAPVVL